MSYPRHQRSRTHKYSSLSAGNITVNTVANTWEQLATESGGPGAGLLDIVVSECQVGDVLRVEPTFLVGTEAVAASFDFKTIVSSSPVNSWVTQGASVSTAPANGPWHAAASVWSPIRGGLNYTVQSGDLSSGTVTIRPYVATASATNRTVYAGSTYLLQWSVENLGPVQA